MSTPVLNDGYYYPPRGLGRIDAARYVGVGLHLFDDMVVDGRMPPPKVINRRRIWDRVAIDVAFASLPDQERDDRSYFQKQMDAKPA